MVTAVSPQTSGWASRLAVGGTGGLYATRPPAPREHYAVDASARANPQRLIVFLILNHFQALDLFGPADVFAYANELEPRSYAVETVAPSAGSVPSSGGPAVVPDHVMAAFRGDPDTLIVTGGRGTEAALREPHLLDWLTAVGARARRVAALSGAASLLTRGRTFTGHAHPRALATEVLTPREAPSEQAVIYMESGNVYSIRGRGRSIDLALAFVEQDLGRETARAVSRRLLLPSARSDKGQRATTLAASASSPQGSLRALEEWIQANLTADLSVTALSRQVAMSERNFARVFRREIGSTPAAYVETKRLEAACVALEQNDKPLKVVAHEAGFTSHDQMRRAFQRRFGLSPSSYRERLDAHARMRRAARA